MDRDTMLKEALVASRHDSQVYVLFKWADRWWYMPYLEFSPGTQHHPETVRYVLPHGEVTKLS
jgi:hypothetical protein